MELHRPRREFPLAKQVRLILAQVLSIELVWPFAEYVANRSTAWM
jgi:hypothetical protein